MSDGSWAERFPRSAKYNPDWLKSSLSGGANSLWLTEWLLEAMSIAPGARVLDLGCGRAASSIFLHREWDCQVWAVDWWNDPSESWQRIRDAGAESGVFPLKADARSLPFPRDFFDAIISIDSFPYYGTDDLYLSYLGRLLRTGGQLGIAGSGLMHELTTIPEQLRQWWEPGMCCLHSADWWRHHWQRTGIVDVERSDSMVDGWKAWLEWHHLVCPANRVEIDAITADAGRTMGYVRTIAHRRPEVHLDDRIAVLPTQYQLQPLLRTK